MKIFKSLVIVFAMAALVGSITNSYFSDTKKIEGNSITTGNIAINLDGVTQAHEPFILTDMKPGYVKSSDFTVNNTGTNPANITKKVDNIIQDVGLAGVLDYKLSVEIFNPSDPSTPFWLQMIYDYDTTLSVVSGNEVFLGMLPAGWSMKVHESYRMHTDANNTYQNHTMTFDIIIKGEQLQGNLTLENKTQDGNWDIIQGDSIVGTLNYGVMDTMFNYSFSATGLTASTDYTLVIGNDYPFTNGKLGSAVTNGAGDITLSGSTDLGTVSNQKVWLIPSTDWNGTAISGWNPTQYLFETGLIDYIKS